MKTAYVDQCFSNWNKCNFTQTKKILLYVLHSFLFHLLKSHLINTISTYLEVELISLEMWLISLLFHLSPIVRYCQICSKHAADETT